MSKQEVGFFLGGHEAGLPKRGRELVAIGCDAITIDGSRVHWYQYAPLPVLEAPGDPAPGGSVHYGCPMRWETFNVVAHRGASDIAPENTMAAFTRAAALGATAIEFDVHQTADGELVVLHDYRVDRTTNGSGIIFEMPWSEVSRFDAGGWFGEDYIGERIPRLSEVLELLDLDFELEIKGHAPAMLELVLDAVDRAGVLDRVKFTGWNLPLLAELKRRRPGATIGLFSRLPDPWMDTTLFEHVTVGLAAHFDAEVAHVHASVLTPSIVERLHAQEAGAGERRHHNGRSSASHRHRG
ncbi:MAG: glycerophosphodiester phosphodiesterase family protein [Acidimicrobiales bacterium]